MTNDELNDKINHLRRLSDFVVLLDSQNKTLKEQLKALKAKDGDDKHDD